MEIQDFFSVRDHLCFWKSGGRRQAIENIKQQEGTYIFYESPHRLLKSLKDIQEVLDDPLVVVARELTKKFEEIRRDQASGHIEHFSKNAPKGEFVLLIHYDG